MVCDGCECGMEVVRVGVMCDGGCDRVWMCDGVSDA